MKILVVYYSYSGITRRLAEDIALITDGDLLELKPLRPYSFSYDRTDGKIYFQIYQAETRIKEVDVNDPNLYLNIFIIG